MAQNWAVIEYSLRIIWPILYEPNRNTRSRDLSTLGHFGNPPVPTIVYKLLLRISRKNPENRAKRQKLFKNIIRNALYELPNQNSSFRPNPTYNVNVDVNETYARENRESVPTRLVPSRTQRVGTKRGQPAEQPIENNDAKRVSFSKKIFL